ncbi:MAG: HAD family hydrolase [Paracoccaceae bacterium]
MTDTKSAAIRYDAVLFDKDGTLFDFAATWEAWARSFLLRMTGEDTARATQIGAAIGFDMATNRFDPGSFVIAGTPGEVTEALIPHLPELSAEAILDVLNEEAAAAPQVEAVPLIPFLDQLRDAGLKTGVATNDAEAPALAHLGAAQVVDRFDFIAGFDSGHGAKPGPGQLLAFCAAVEVDPSRAVMVGDSTHDLLAGRAAGMATAAVLTGMATAEDLSPHADVVLPNIGHLPGWLGL